jgi:hypothetical protein
LASIFSLEPGTERHERRGRSRERADMLRCYEEGRHSLHRVSPIHGDTPRYVALFGYDTKPDTMSSDLLKQIRYVRTEPVAAR